MSWINVIRTKCCTLWLLVLGNLVLKIRLISQQLLMSIIKLFVIWLKLVFWLLFFSFCMFVFILLLVSRYKDNFSFSRFFQNDFFATAKFICPRFYSRGTQIKSLSICYSIQVTNSIQNFIQINSAVTVWTQTYKNVREFTYL